MARKRIATYIGELLRGRPCRRGGRGIFEANGSELGRSADLVQRGRLNPALGLVAFEECTMPTLTHNSGGSMVCANAQAENVDGDRKCLPNSRTEVRKFDHETITASAHPPNAIDLAAGQSTFMTMRTIRHTHHARPTAGHEEVASRRGRIATQTPPHRSWSLARYFTS